MILLFKESDETITCASITDFYYSNDSNRCFINDHNGNTYVTDMDLSKFYSFANALAIDGYLDTVKFGYIFDLWDGDEDD